MVIEMVRQQPYRLTDAKACVELLGNIDAAIAQDASAGETTCVLVVTTPTEIFGASVGDSGAWLKPTQGEHVNLTCGQQRKPFLGNGVAKPHPFQQHGLRGHLLLATDGLLKYTAAETITTICRTTDGKAAAEQLINAVRYPSGALPDDVTVVLTKI